VGGSERLEAASLTDLVERALTRDQAAWAVLVKRLERVVWKSVNVVTSDPQLRKDAFGTTFLRLAEHLATVREPEKLAGWLAVTATREAMLLSKSEARLRLTVSAATEPLLSAAPPASPAAQVEQDDAVRVVRAALARLGEPCRELLTVLLVVDPPLSYTAIAERFDKPHGWIGPTRERCMGKLRRDPEVAALIAGGRW
jgi:RNA polymerase sigma factor (sigma-70 family)